MEELALPRLPIPKRHGFFKESCEEHVLSESCLEDFPSERSRRNRDSPKSPATRSFEPWLKNLLADERAATMSRHKAIVEAVTRHLRTSPAAAEAAANMTLPLPTEVRKGSFGMAATRELPTLAEEECRPRTRSFEGRMLADRSAEKGLLERQSNPAGQRSPAERAPPDKEADEVECSKYGLLELPSELPSELTYGSTIASRRRSSRDARAPKWEDVHEESICNLQRAKSVVLPDSESRSRPSSSGCGQYVESLVAWHGFELFWALVIVTNAVLIGVECNYSATRLAWELPDGFFVAGLCYTSLFTVELLLRIAASRGAFLCGGVWSALDLFIVTTSLFDTALDVAGRMGLDISGQLSDMGDTQQVRIMRLIRITRLVRIFRIARIVRFIRALQNLLMSIVATLKALIWAILLLVMIIYVFGIVFTQASTEYLRDSTLGLLRDEPDNHAPDREAVAKFWGSLPASMYTLFLSITSGISWVEVVEPLGRISLIWLWLFLSFVVFCHFAVLNVVTAFFCQSAMEASQHDNDLMIASQLAMRNAYIEKATALFNDLDGENMGFITLTLLENSLGSDEVRAFFDALALDCSDAWTLFKLIDTEGTHQVGIEEFIDGCMRLRGSAKAIDMIKLTHDQSRIMRWLLDFMVCTEERLLELLECVGLDDGGDISTRIPQFSHLCKQATRTRLQQLQSASTRNLESASTTNLE